MPEPSDRSMQDLKPTVWIGKQGCTGTMIEEIVSQLKKRKLIKVKWLQNTEVDPETVAVQAKARLVEVRGRTMVLAEKGRSSQAESASEKKPASRVTAKEKARAAVVPKGPARAARRPPAPARKDSAPPKPAITGPGKEEKPHKDTPPKKHRQIGVLRRAGK